MSDQGIHWLQSLRRVYIRALLVLIFLSTSVYLLSPVALSGSQPPEMLGIRDPETNLHDNLLDCFLLRDDSASPSTLAYDGLEQAVFSQLSLTGDDSNSDRFSYASFGSETRPRLIPRPSPERKSLLAYRGTLGKYPRFRTTDFALLFREISSAIRRDREAHAASQRAPHADSVIIVSDGVPDLSGSDRECPSTEREFISDDIIEKFDALIHGYYPTQEPIYVRLILAGIAAGCDYDIKGEWERRLAGRAGPGVFEVIAYPGRSGSGGGPAADLLPLRHQPRMVLTLAPPKNKQRRNLDSGEVFSVQYSARSYRGDFTAIVEAGSIFDGLGQEVASLQVMNDPEKLPGDSDSQVVISTKAPLAGDEFFGAAARGSLYMIKVPNSSQKISEYATYQLRLKLSTRVDVEVMPPSLSIEPSFGAKQRLISKERLSRAVWLPTCIGLALFVILGFCAILPSTLGKEIGLVGIVERLLVTPRIFWACLLGSLTFPMLVCVAVTEGPAIGVLGAGMLFGLLMFVVERNWEDGRFIVLLRSIEFIVLPLLVEGVANYLFL